MVVTSLPKHNNHETSYLDAKKKMCVCDSGKVLSWHISDPWLLLSLYSKWKRSQNHNSMKFRGIANLYKFLIRDMPEQMCCSHRHDAAHCNCLIYVHSLLDCFTSSIHSLIHSNLTEWVLPDLIQLHIHPSCRFSAFLNIFMNFLLNILLNWKGNTILLLTVQQNPFNLLLRKRKYISSRFPMKITPRRQSQRIVCGTILFPAKLTTINVILDNETFIIRISKGVGVFFEGGGKRTCLFEGPSFKQ